MRTRFQCNLCHFRNMKGRDLTEGSDKYEKLVISISRAFPYPERSTYRVEVRMYA